MSKFIVKSTVTNAVTDSEQFQKYFQNLISEQILSIVHIPDLEKFSSISVNFKKSTLKGDLLKALIAMPFNSLSVLPVTLQVTVAEDSKIIESDDDSKVVYYVKGASRKYKIDCKISVTKTEKTPASTFVTESEVELVSSKDSEIFMIHPEYGMYPLRDDDYLAGLILSAEEDDATVNFSSDKGNLAWESNHDYRS